MIYKHHEITCDSSLWRSSAAAAQSPRRRAVAGQPMAPQLHRNHLPPSHVKSLAGEHHTDHSALALTHWLHTASALFK